MAVPTRDVLKIAPVNAWLLIGDAAAYPTARELDQMRRRGTPSDIWTAPPQALPGDLLLFYFMHPIKEIRFAARAASNPFFDASIHVNAERVVDRHQWWITHTRLLEVPPVSFRELADALGGHVVLKGKPRHYLSPQVVDRLAAIMAQRNGGRLGSELADVVRTPVGDPNLPDPGEVSLEVWSRMADGAFRLERQVEQYVVEPLLRMALAAAAGFDWKQAHRVPGGGIADYVIVRNGVPTSVVEAKLGVAEPRNGRWSASPEFAQVTRYMERLGVPGMLVDSRRAYLVNLGAAEPSQIVHRASATADDLAAIGRHLKR